jgi:FecR-like protein
MSDDREISVGADEADVREALREAGPRAEISPEDLAAVASAAREEWLQVARERRRAHRVAWAAAAALAVLVAGFLSWRLRSVPPVPALPSAGIATVERVAGETLGSGETPLAPGAELPAGAVLTTGAASARASSVALRLASGPSVRLDSGSRVRLVSPVLLELEAGALYVDSRGVALDVRTPFGSVHDRGTQFELRLLAAQAAALRVRVREGRVEVRGGAAPLQAAAGDELTLHSDGRTSRARIDPASAEWSWAAAAAAPPAIEGRPLAEILEWVARETGRRLVYADAQLAAEAARVRLHGSIADLSPEDALQVVLAGSGLRSRIDGGVLKVERAAR